MSWLCVAASQSRSRPSNPEMQPQARRPSPRPLLPSFSDEMRGSGKPRGPPPNQFTLRLPQATFHDALPRLRGSGWQPWLQTHAVKMRPSFAGKVLEVFTRILGGFHVGPQQSAHSLPPSVPFQLNGPQATHRQAPCAPSTSPALVGSHSWLPFTLRTNSKRTLFRWACRAPAGTQLSLWFTPPQPPYALATGSFQKSP